jgi:hypothetical protein
MDTLVSGRRFRVSLRPWFAIATHHPFNRGDQHRR